MGLFSPCVIFTPLHPQTILPHQKFTPNGCASVYFKLKKNLPIQKFPTNNGNERDKSKMGVNISLHTVTCITIGILEAPYPLKFLELIHIYLGFFNFLTKLKDIFVSWSLSEYT